MKKPIRWLNQLEESLTRPVECIVIEQKVRRFVSVGPEGWPRGWERVAAESGGRLFAAYKRAIRVWEKLFIYRVSTKLLPCDHIRVSK